MSTVKRRLLTIVVGYLLSWAVIAYIVLAAAVRGPIDWPLVIQTGLVTAPFGSFVAVLVVDYNQS